MNTTLKMLQNDGSLMTLIYFNLARKQFFFIILYFIFRAFLHIHFWTHLQNLKILFFSNCFFFVNFYQHFGYSRFFSLFFCFEFKHLKSIWFIVLWILFLTNVSDSFSLLWHLSVYICNFHLIFWHFFITFFEQFNCTLN